MITIVIPLYNKYKHIRSCLDSVLTATYNYTYECIVIDDFSNDGSGEIAASFCNEHNSNFTYLKCLRNHEISPSYARNLGIRLCQPKYITFFDADDTYCEGYLDRAIDFMENKDNENVSLYMEGYNVFEKEDTYYNFYPFIPPSNDYNWYLGNVRGLLIRGVFRSDEVKDYRFVGDIMEDSLFMLDFLYPNKIYHMENNFQAFNYYAVRQQQETYSSSLLKDLGMTSQEYLENFIYEKYNYTRQ